MRPQFSHGPAGIPALVEDLLFEAFDDAPWPHASIKHAGPASVEIDLDGPEFILVRLAALHLLAGALGDDEGPEVTPTLRYTCADWRGTFFLVRLTVTQAEIDAARDGI